MYSYYVLNVAKVIDGDTFDFDLDLGFYARLRIRVRLDGIDTYEIYGRNAHELGPVARDFAADWMEKHHEALAVRTFKLSDGTPVADGSFGRWLGNVYDAADGTHLVDALRDAGLEKKEGS